MENTNQAMFFFPLITHKTKTTKKTTTYKCKVFPLIPSHLSESCLFPFMSTWGMGSIRLTHFLQSWYSWQQLRGLGSPLRLYGLGSRGGTQLPQPLTHMPPHCSLHVSPAGYSHRFKSEGGRRGEDYVKFMLQGKLSKQSMFSLSSKAKMKKSACLWA